MPDGLFADKDYLMIIQCDKCSTKFRLDDSRITGNGVRVRCTKCQHVFIVAPPPPAEEVGAEAEVLEAGQDAYAAPKRVAPPARKSADNNLKFDFDSSLGGESAAQAPSGGPDAGHSAAEAPASGNKPSSFDEIDYSFATDRSAEMPSEAAPEDGSFGTAAGGPQTEFTAGEPEAKPGEPPGENPLDTSWSMNYDFSGDTEGETPEVPSDWEIGAPGKGKNTLREDSVPVEEKPPFSEFGFGAGEKENKEGAPAPSVTDNGWSIGTDAADEKTAGTVLGNSPEGYGAGEGGQQAASAASSHGSDGRPAEEIAPSQTPEEKPVPETLKFSQYFSEEKLKEEEREAAAENAFIGEVEESEEEEDEEEAQEAASGAGRALIIAALVFLAGGAVIYFSGVIDNLAGRFATPARVASEKSVDIETVKGYYTENKNFGKFFVIEATIKNISAEPQAVRAVTGLLYDSKGAKIASRSVAPGRVVSAEDLGNLSKEDLLKPFKDPSGGTLPPKGTVPVMVPFIDPPAGISEYGIDIIR